MEHKSGMATSHSRTFGCLCAAPVIEQFEQRTMPTECSAEPFVWNRVVAGFDARTRLDAGALLLRGSPWPSAVNRTTFARQTCFWGLFRLATTASNARRSAAFSVV